MSRSQEDQVEEIENFFGVYLLLSQNIRYKGRTYVGFTVDPIRRLKQHNGGCEAGGAWKTNNRGPWSMVLIVYGFPNMISALRFEWAWQHPQKSRRLNHLPPKKRQERLFPYHIKLLSNMLNSGPWNRLPLNVRWLRPDLKGNVDFCNELPPPMHMSITYGPIKAVKKKKTERKKGQKSDDPSTEAQDEAVMEELLCGLCIQPVVSEEDLVRCISPKCATVSHMICLAQHFRQTSQEKSNLNYFLPVDGTCPVCDFHCLWGDIIKKKKGCYQNLPFKEGDEEDDDEENDDEREEMDHEEEINEEVDIFAEIM